MLLLVGAFSGVIAIPLAVKSGCAFAYFVAGKLNFDILTKTIPLQVYIYLMLASLLLPVLLSVSILLKGTREIGVMRAIGATPKKIYVLFLNEGMITCVISILVGLLISYPLTKLAAVFFGRLMLGNDAKLEYAFSSSGFFITLAVTPLFGWMASRIPAKSAIKVSTHSALSYE